MGAYDQAARFATKADREPVMRGLLAPTKTPIPSHDWQDTRTLPFPGGSDRTADLVAVIDGTGEEPTLVVMEFQSEHNPEKLDATLEVVGTIRYRARRGPDRKGKYKVLAALIYLQGSCPSPVLDMTVPGGFGTHHAPLIWNVEKDKAAETLEAVTSGLVSWGSLFWVPLMEGGNEKTVIARWKEVVTQVVSDRGVRGDLSGIALVFSELVGRGVEWKRQLEGFQMTESPIVNEWMKQGETRGTLKERRQNLLEALRLRFPGSVPDDVIRAINEQESLPILGDWFRASQRATTFEQFMEVMTR